ncbi:hypothetical protein LINGRAHAP2_LOCUS21571 [Linum grandiflorum]
MPSSRPKEGTRNLSQSGANSLLHLNQQQSSRLEKKPLPNLRTVTMPAACQPDKDISRWVSEFLIRQPIPGFLVESVISSLDALVVDTDWRLKKKGTLRLIHQEISKKGSLSEKMLEWLETVEKCDRENGIAITETMKAAYAALALECTLGGFCFEVLERIWRGRVRNLEKLQESELVTDELRKCWDDMEAAVWDLDLRYRLLESAKRKDALGLVMAYLEEAMMGNDEPSFLELAARREKGLEENAKHRHEEKDGSASQADIMQDLGAEGGMNNGLEQVPDDDRQPVTVSSPIAETKKGYRRVKCVPSRKRPTRKYRSIGNIPSSKYDTLSTPEVKQVKDALQSSSIELQAVVKDPLPDALHRSEPFIAELQQDVCNKEALVKNHNGENMGASGPSADVIMSELNSRGLNPDVHAEKSNGIDEDGPAPSNILDPGRMRTDESNKAIHSSECLNVSKPSLMARNSSACTHEWYDSMGSSSEGTSDGTRRNEIKRPKTELVPPSTKDDGTCNSPRRKKRKWSAEEEDALREGVNEFGKGHWKYILNSRRDIFVGRSMI